VSDHSRIESQIATMHRVIAARLRSGDWSPLAHAKANLDRWRGQFDGALPLAYAEWLQVLDQGGIRLLEVLESDDEDAVRRRSSSPFAGVLTPQERWRILRHAA